MSGGIEGEAMGGRVGTEGQGGGGTREGGVETDGGVR